MAEPIRTVHHFACTGGTLIAKIIASMPNVVMLNEIDPLSHLHLQGLKQPFIPTDPIAALRYSRRDVDNRLIMSMFTAALGVLKNELDETGRYLVLRDHTHSHFCTGNGIADRASLRDICGTIADLRSVVTVRYPLFSYVSMSERNWLHFQPASLEEYCLRYMAFLDACQDLSIYRYEDLVTDPETVARQVCDDLALPFRSTFENTLSAFTFSGDSGRTGANIQPRPSKAVPPAITAEAEVSETFSQLCARLGYDGR